MRVHRECEFDVEGSVVLRMMVLSWRFGRQLQAGPRAGDSGPGWPGYVELVVRLGPVDWRMTGRQCPLPLIGPLRKADPLREGGVASPIFRLVSMFSWRVFVSFPFFPLGFLRGLASVRRNGFVCFSSTTTVRG